MADEQSIQPMEAAQQVDAADSEVEAHGNKYVLPLSIYFLRQNRRIPLSELSNLQIVPDKKGKMTIRGETIAADGKVHKASTYLGIKKDPNAPKKKRVRAKKAKIQEIAEPQPADAPAASD
jgi:hypothetical protein